MQRGCPYRTLPDVSDGGAVPPLTVADVDGTSEQVAGVKVSTVA